MDSEENNLESSSNNKEDDSIEKSPGNNINNESKESNPFQKEKNTSLFKGPSLFGSKDISPISKVNYYTPQIRPLEKDPKNENIITKKENLNQINIPNKESQNKLFFNDEIMRQIYTYKGNTNAAIHVTNIIMSSVCCLIMNFIVRLISLNERDIQKINSENNPDNRTALAEKSRRCLKIKLSVLFVVSAILIGICWYYVAAFCAVFKNSQGHYFINLLVAFIVCNIWPCVTSLIPPIFRLRGLWNGSKCMYKFSQIIAYI